jgi:hypothetical protein
MCDVMWIVEDIQFDYRMGWRDTITYLSVSVYMSLFLSAPI